MLSGPMRRLTPRSPRSRTISPSTLIVSTRSRSAPQHERFGIGSGRAVVPVWRGTARNGPVLETGAERMNQSREPKNKALVLEAFEILFNKRDYTARRPVLSSRTHGLVGAAEQERMKPTARLINA